MRQDYEFSAVENVRIRGAATWSRLAGFMEVLVGAVCIAGGAISLARSFFMTLVLWFVATIYIAVGASFIGAASAFARAVDTEGSDITNILQALVKLKTAFKIQVIVVVVTVVLAVLVFLLLGVRR